MAKNKEIDKMTQIEPLVLNPVEQEFKDRYKVSDFEAKTAVKKINVDSKIEEIKSEIAAERRKLAVPEEKPIYKYFTSGNRNRMIGEMKADKVNFKDFLIEMYQYSLVCGAVIEQSNVDLKCGVLLYYYASHDKRFDKLFKNVWLSTSIKPEGFEVIVV